MLGYFLNHTHNMLKKNILSAALVAGAIVAPAFAGTPAAPAPAPVAPAKAPAITEYPFSGKVFAGVVNQYSEKGLVPTNAYTEDEMGVIGGLCAEYKTPWGFGVNGAYSAQSFELDTKGLADTARQQDLWLGVGKEFGTFLRSDIGWHMTKGGLPGFASVLDSNFNEGNDLFQEIYTTHKVNLEDCLGLTGMFYKLGTGHSYDETTGHWFGNTIGVRTEVTQMVDAIFSVSANYSHDYWASGVSGWDAVVLKLETPIKASEHFEVVPFISTNWGAHSAQALNNIVPAGFTPVFENFAIVTGLYGTYSF